MPRCGSDRTRGCQGTALLFCSSPCSADRREKKKTLQVLTKVEEAFNKAKTTVTNLSDEIDLKSKVGEFVYAAGDISTQAIEKASDLNDKYKITDQASAKVKEVVDKAKSNTDL
mmetsp:Transcript_14847/g.56231  ORF Transcript_14847/g.56231 Transcript_14847/m.56231 type:complete len:114 (-) Transcript_14847:967-1308(-)